MKDAADCVGRAVNSAAAKDVKLGLFSLGIDKPVFLDAAALVS